MEMVDEKGLDPGAADRIGEYVRYQGKQYHLFCSNHVLSHIIVRYQGKHYHLFCSNHVLSHIIVQWVLLPFNLLLM